MIINLKSEIKMLSFWEMFVNYKFHNFFLTPCFGHKLDKLHLEQKRLVRFLPENINIASTFIIYDDIVSIVSSKKENFGFTLKSEELAQSMKALFEALWTKADKSW